MPLFIVAGRMRDLNARWFQKLVDESIDFSEELRVPEIKFHSSTGNIRAESSVN